MQVDTFKQYNAGNKTSSFQVTTSV